MPTGDWSSGLGDRCIVNEACRTRRMMFVVNDCPIYSKTGRKEGNVLFNDALNTFYLQLYGRKEGNVLFNDAFIYGYMVSDIW